MYQVLRRELYSHYISFVQFKRFTMTVCKVEEFWAASVLAWPSCTGRLLPWVTTVCCCCCCFCCYNKFNTTHIQALVHGARHMIAVITSIGCQCVNIWTFVYSLNPYGTHCKMIEAVLAHAIFITWENFFAILILILQSDNVLPNPSTSHSLQYCHSLSWRVCPCERTGLACLHSRQCLMRS